MLIQLTLIRYGQTSYPDEIAFDILRVRDDIVQMEKQVLECLI
jgi:hypothetical protein